MENLEQLVSRFDKGKIRTRKGLWCAASVVSQEDSPIIRKYAPHESFRVNQNIVSTERLLEAELGGAAK
jgi:hypothetical protein